MPGWLNYGIGIVVGAVVIGLFAKYGDRRWLTKWRSHI